MKKPKFFLRICFAILAGFIVYYVVFIYMRTPEYIHCHVTPIYEEEAKEYFQENKEQFLQLSTLLKQMNTSENYYYSHTFSALTSDTGETSREISNVLTKLEASTEKNYTVTIAHSNIQVLIKSGTNFDVFLYYGDFYKYSENGHKKTELEGGWTIDAFYTVRS